MNSVAPSINAAQKARLPAPRLQLRWERYTGPSDFGSNWQCHYELVLPLREHDIRREVYEDGEQVGERSELIVPIKGPQLRGSEATPCTVYGTGERYADAPFRDGAHAHWDAKTLGDLPVFVIAPDGLALAFPDKSEASQ